MANGRWAPWSPSPTRSAKSKTTSASPSRSPHASRNHPALRGAWLGYSGFVGDHHQLGAVACVELHQQPADVGLDGGVAHEQAGRDLGVRLTLGHQLEHLALTVG